MSWKNTIQSSLAMAMIAGLAINSPLHAAVVAHWSFDTPTITTDVNGNILTAADSTGAHNAVGFAVGTATSASVAGQFGQALQLNNPSGNQGGTLLNGAYLEIPQLTELMGPTGPNYTIAGWVNLTGTNNNALLADWGNVPSGGDRFPYWFAINGARQRAQSRSGTGSGVDMYARQVANVPENLVNDGTWHHVAWTFEKDTPAAGDGTLLTYRDGVLIDTFTNIPTNAAATLEMMVGSSLVGSIGRKSDNNDMYVGGIDELYVFDRTLPLGAIRGLISGNAIPEPTSALLALFGAAALGLIRRRQR